MKQRAAGL